MKRFRADMHIHTVLSPCGSLDMSPGRIVREAVVKKLDIIAVTDHNHTGHARIIRRLGEQAGLYVVYGAEVTTREEVHCLAFFDTDEQLVAFQEYLDEHLPFMENNPDYFGDQVIVDRDEMILEEISHSLYPGIDQSIDEVAKKVLGMDGLFVPAHVDRKMNGLYAQIGFLPPYLDVSAVEIHRNTNPEEYVQEHPELEKLVIVQNSDAHYPEDIGRKWSEYLLEEPGFTEIAKAYRGEDGREVIIP